MLDAIKKIFGAGAITLPDGMKMFDMVVARKVAETGWREGQAMFNTLDELYPRWAEEIRTTDKDPYYVMEPDDPRMGAFMDWLREKFVKLDAALAERAAEPQRNMTWEPVTAEQRAAEAKAEAEAEANKEMK